MTRTITHAGHTQSTCLASTFHAIGQQQSSLSTILCLTSARNGDTVRMSVEDCVHVLREHGHTDRTECMARLFLWACMIWQFTVGRRSMCPESFS
jgi:hypothetical protein